MSGSGPSGSLFVFADVGFGSEADVTAHHRIRPLRATSGRWEVLRAGLGSASESAYVTAKHVMLELTQMRYAILSGLCLCVTRRGIEVEARRSPGHLARASDPRGASGPAAEQALRHCG